LFFFISMLISCKKETINNTNDTSVERPLQITASIKALIKEKLTTADYDNINWGSTVIKSVLDTEFKIIQIEFASENEINSTFFALISLNNSNDYIRGRIVKIKATSFDSLHQINGTLYEANLDRTNEENFDIASGKKVTNTSSIRVEPSITIAEWYYLLNGLGVGYSIYTGTSGGSGSSSGTGPTVNTSGGTGNNAPPATTYTFLSLFLTNQLQLNENQKNWLNTHHSLALEIFDALGNDEMPVGNIPIEDKQASKITIDAAMAGQINTPINETHYNTYVRPNLPSPQNLNNYNPMWGVYFSIYCATLKQEYPEWSDSKVYWEATLEMLHIGLDVVGLVPLVGEIADITNGVIYTIQGDGVNATLSYAGAIPVAGWGATGVKFAKRSLIALNGSKKILYLKKTINGLIDFGDRGQLRSVLGLARGSLSIAHHLIPWSLSSHPLVQKAAGAGFHLNHYNNGIPLSAIQHNSGGHLEYNTKVSNYLQNQINNYLGGINAISNIGAENILNILNNQIRTWIINNPGVSINNIVL
jgi:hypothetical protein